MKKSIKTKIVTGAVAIGLLSGVGAAFASTDAGTQLQTWYNKEFAKSSGSIADDTGGYGAAKAVEFEREYRGVKAKVTSDINTQKDNSISSSRGAINTAKDGYISQVNDKKAIIAGQMEAQFNQISKDANTIINLAGSQAQILAFAELKTLSESNGSNALTKVQEDITRVKNSAITDLEAAIRDAKQELTTQLNDETTATTKEIKDAIDAKIVQLRGAITTRANELVITQQNLIQAKATELEIAAKAELDSIVNNIKN